MQNKEEESQSWIKLGVVLLFISSIGLLTVLGGGEEMNLNFDDPATLFKLKIMQGVGTVFLFVIPAIVFALVWTKAKAAYLGVTKIPSILSFIYSGIGIIFALPLINWLAEVNQKMKLPSFMSGIEQWMLASEEQAKVLTEAFIKGDTVDVLIINLIVIALLAALSEELFFRGVLQNVLHECVKNKHLAVWIAAILFSAFHLQFYGFLPRMLMGAYLGYLFLWSGSLWTSIFAHFVNNGMAVLMMWLANRGDISMDVEDVGTHSDEWLSVLMSMFLVLGSVYLLRKQSLVPAKIESEDSEVKS